MTSFEITSLVADESELSSADSLGIIRIATENNMAIIRKKIWPEYFDLIESGKKKFELRLDDFEIHEGDALILEEWNPKEERYTGRKIERKAGYILKFKLNDFGQENLIKEKGMQIISLE